MLVRRFFLLVSFYLAALTATYAQRVPDLATAEAKAATSQQKAAELKATAETAKTTLTETKVQVKAQEKALKELQKAESKQEGELRNAITKQKTAEMQAKQDLVTVKEAKKREKAAAKLTGKK